MSWEEFPIYDESYLSDVSDGDTSLIQELIQIFLEDTSERLEKIQLFFLQRSQMEFSREIHTLRGASSQAGALRIQMLGKVIERKASSSLWDEITDMLTTLESEFLVFVQTVTLKYPKLSVEFEPAN